MHDRNATDLSAVAEGDQNAADVAVAEGDQNAADVAVAEGDQNAADLSAVAPKARRPM